MRNTHRVIAAFRSDPGKRRTNNEDSVLSDIESGIFVLADGMGGHQAGEVASDIAVRKAYDFLKEKVSGPGVPDYRESLLGAFVKANNAVRQASLMDKALTGMGTTLILAVVHDGKCSIGSIGDSRAYLLRESIMQITGDQTVGAFLAQCDGVEEDDIDPAYWHVLTQAVGANPDLEPELIEMSLKNDDILILCSDGLSDMLSDDEIKAVCGRCGGDVDCIADSLVSAANDNGGFDNISLIAVKF